MPMSIWLSVVRPITVVASGASIAMRGSLAAALTKASSERLMPGAMIPPVYAPELPEQPPRIFVGSPARISRDAPARLDRAAVHEREDEVGVSGVDREQHARPLGEEPAVAKRVRR